MTTRAARDIPPGGPLRDAAIGEDSFKAALYAYAGDTEALARMLLVIAGCMRASLRLDELRGDPTPWC